MRFAFHLFGGQISLVPCSRLISRAYPWNHTHVCAQPLETTMRQGQATCCLDERNLFYWLDRAHWSLLFTCHCLQTCSLLSRPHVAFRPPTGAVLRPTQVQSFPRCIPGLIHSLSIPRREAGHGLRTPLQSVLSLILKLWTPPHSSPLPLLIGCLWISLLSWCGAREERDQMEMSHTHQCC